MTRDFFGVLLLLLVMDGVLANARRVLADLQLFTAGLAHQRVVVVACFLAHEVNDFGFLLALGHRAPLTISEWNAGPRDTVFGCWTQWESRNIAGGADLFLGANRRAVCFELADPGSRTNIVASY